MVVRWSQVRAHINQLLLVDGDTLSNRDMVRQLTDESADFAGRLAAARDRHATYVQRLDRARQRGNDDTRFVYKVNKWQNRIYTLEGRLTAIGNNIEVLNGQYANFLIERDETRADLVASIRQFSQERHGFGGVILMGLNDVLALSEFHSELDENLSLFVRTGLTAGHHLRCLNRIRIGMNDQFFPDGDFSDMATYQLFDGNRGIIIVPAEEAAGLRIRFR